MKRTNEDEEKSPERQVLQRLEEAIRDASDLLPQLEIRETKQRLWEEAQERAFQSVPEDARFHYNVGGEIAWFTCESMLRFPESIFAVRASGNWKREEVVYLDRDPDVFRRIIVKALRTGCLETSTLNQYERDEVVFYGLTPLSVPPEWEMTSGLTFADGVFANTSTVFQYARGPSFDCVESWTFTVNSEWFDIGIIDASENIAEYQDSYSIYRYAGHDRVRLRNLSASGYPIWKVGSIVKLCMQKDSRECLIEIDGQFTYYRKVHEGRFRDPRPYLGIAPNGKISIKSE